MSRPAALDEYPKTVVLNDGTHVVLRPAGEADRPALAAALAGAGEGMRADDPETIRVVALDGRRLAGVASLTSGRDGDERRVAVWLDPVYEGRRLGTWMLLDLVHLAGALEIARLVVSVPTGAEALEAALRRLDFVAVTGSDARSFTKTLHVGWPDF